MFKKHDVTGVTKYNPSVECNLCLLHKSKCADNNDKFLRFKFEMLWEGSSRRYLWWYYKKLSSSSSNISESCDFQIS